MRSAGLKQMLRTIKREMAATAIMTGRVRLAPQVLAALAEVPRDEFVPESEKSFAFGDYPLPIGAGQTISQPFIVALMTDLLEVEPTHRVLEIGTGSGYQTAILSSLAHQVYSLEIVPALAQQAAERLRRLGYHNVQVETGDGHDGWPQQAPFDRIIVTAAAARVPRQLLSQLKSGGRMVIPLGQPDCQQELVLVTKGEIGDCHMREVLGVVFVPMTGGGQN